jgi:16S rRNA (guanine966-N2)-methyltransferase
LRIIAGSAKGKKLITPAGREVTRPTADKVREAIFGSIQFEIAGSKVLDLFAGSGALGIEALSRQAEKAVFVDRAREAITAIRCNLKNADLQQRAEVLLMDYQNALNRLQEPFDFIFVDPPYRAELYQNVLKQIKEKKLLAPDGLLIVEHDQSADFEAENVLKVKKYGKTFVTYIGGAQR